jgi:hypothetical protein
MRNHLTAALLSLSAQAVEWNHDQAEIFVDLARTAYCSHTVYPTHVFTGPTQGFEVTSVLYDDLYDINGYIGYLPSEDAIYVVFRGTVSAKNDYIDGLIDKVDYTMWPECDCKVHEGFQMGYLQVSDQALSEV